MSALWVLALGASIGYLAFKKQAIESRLDMAVKEYDSRGAQESMPKAPDGASVNEIKQAWRYTEDTRNRDFNERLPANERMVLLAAEDARANEVSHYNKTTEPAAEIQGVYLETTAGF